IAGPIAGVAPPDPRLLRAPGVRSAAPSVVRVLGTACGLAVEGSGWVARAELVVTAAHVVAGEHDTSVDVPGSSSALHATPVAVDARNDVAVLRVPGLSVGPLRLVDPVPGAAVAILGYPGDGPFDAKPGRIGRTATVLSQDAYGRGRWPARSRASAASYATATRVARQSTPPGTSRRPSSPPAS